MASDQQNLMRLSLKQRILKRNSSKNSGKRKAGKEFTVTQPAPKKTTATKYHQAYKKYLNAIRDEVKAEIIPILQANKKQFSPKTISDAIGATVLAQLERVFQSIRRKLLSNLRPEAVVISRAFVGQVNEDNTNGFKHQVRGIDVSGLLFNEQLEGTLMGSITSNVNFIVDVPNEFLTKIEGVVYRNVTQGSTMGSMIKDLQGAYNFSNNRAKLIARDQTSKVNSALTEQRQTNLGITEYIWRTVKDERVRPEHKRNNGKIFKWASPPKNTGHPGHDIQCRCRAEGILSFPQ